MILPVSTPPPNPRAPDQLNPASGDCHTPPSADPPSPHVPHDPSLPHAWLIGDNIARFRPPPPSSPNLRPFPGYIAQPQPIGPLPLGFPIRPRYSHRGNVAV